MSKLNIAAWSPHDVRSIYSMLSYMRKAEISTIEEALAVLRQYMDTEVAARKKIMPEQGRKRQRQLPGKAMVPSVRCSQCGGLVQLQPVNTCRGSRTGDDSRTAIICMSTACRHSEYSEQAPEDFKMVPLAITVDESGRLRIHTGEDI